MMVTEAKRPRFMPLQMIARARRSACFAARRDSADVSIREAGALSTSVLPAIAYASQPESEYS